MNPREGAKRFAVAKPEDGHLWVERMTECVTNATETTKGLSGFPVVVLVEMLMSFEYVGEISALAEEAWRTNQAQDLHRRTRPDVGWEGPGGGTRLGGMSEISWGLIAWVS